MPDVPPHEVEGLLQSTSFVNLSTREATRAQVARLVATQASTPVAAGTPRGAAPGGAGQGKKRRAVQEPTGTAASAQMTAAGKMAFREWTQTTGKCCQDLGAPKSTRPPCFFYLCTQDSSGVKCKEGNNCRFQHNRPSAQEPGQARALYDKVWNSFSSKAELPFSR